MTRKEASFILANIDRRVCDDELNDALDMAIKALEQEQCGNAISRQAVLDKLNRLIEVERLQGTDKMGYGRERVSAYEHMIFEIESEYLYPSVNSQEPKTGCWIEHEIEGTLKWLECSNCHCETSYNVMHNYCPNCGARMESEDKG